MVVTDFGRRLAKEGNLPDHAPDPAGHGRNGLIILGMWIGQRLDDLLSLLLDKLFDAPFGDFPRRIPTENVVTDFFDVFMQMLVLIGETFVVRCDGVTIIRTNVQSNERTQQRTILKGIV